VLGLAACGFAPYSDQHDIAPGEDWQRRLTGLIAEADTVVYVISDLSLEGDQVVLARQHPRERIEQALLRFRWRAVRKTLRSAAIENRFAGNLPIGVQPVLLRLDRLRIFCIIWLCFGFRVSRQRHFA
jgi:hypothetical protein